MAVPLEQIREAIASPLCECVSFDVFDTLLLRPFWEPCDLFYFLGIYGKKAGACKDAAAFVKLRRKAEQKARLRRAKAEPECQDITLEEIYSVLSEMLRWTEETALRMKKREMELESEFCYPRGSGLELYRFARSCGKEIICISDMYLSEEFISRLLKKNGFASFSGIYVSSDRKKGKYTGDLYDAVLRERHIAESRAVVHIGDNRDSDFEMARRKGLQAFWLPKAKEEYLRKYPLAAEPLELEERCRTALSANVAFDNPFMEAPADADLEFSRVFSAYLSYFSSQRPAYLRSPSSKSFWERMKGLAKRILR